ncbi:MAG: helix-turn-helix transcriptional regulator [Candidatus Aminicenantes bacterium]|nr:helix-turn-helix transcriptional regulator [Candidatus Aminicenantes bacterium]
MGIYLSEKNLTESDLVVEYVLTLQFEELETLSVESIAGELGLSRTRLWRSFKKEKKITIEEYIFRIKINQAAFLLQEEPGLSIREIAEKTGYYCYDYFIRVFREYFGASPGKYKELKNSADKDKKRQK